MNLRTLLLFLFVLSCVTLYLLAVATGHTSKLSEYFASLFTVNLLIVLSLSYLLSRQFIKLWRDRRDRGYGSKLSLSMIKRFTLVAVLPGLFLFAVSAQFISHSINSWFSDSTREALDRSLNLSKISLNNFTGTVTEHAQLAALKVQYGLSLGQSLSDVFSSAAMDFSKFDQVAIFNPQGEVLQVSSNPLGLPWPSVGETDWTHVANSLLYTDTEIYRGKLYLEIFIHVYSQHQPEVILFFRQKVPENIATDVDLITKANEKYAELTYHKKGIQLMFILTLLVATLLSIFLALLAAIVFSRRFVEPLIALSDSTTAVSKGDFSKKNPVWRDDELGELSESFNKMTDELKTEREKSRLLFAKEEEARAYFESVLLNLTTGVITLDANGYVKTYNHSVEVILDCSLAPYLDLPWYAWATEDAHISFLKAFMKALFPKADGHALEFEYSVNDNVQILLGKALRLQGGQGLVMVFDDVTTLAKAQKEAAWGEVARRLAHEIKNPLTPIQLSAERVQWKLTDKLEKKDADLLAHATHTIIQQVAALKEMVEGFRNYARKVSLNLELIDFNDLLKEVLHLYEGMDCTFTTNLSKMSLPVRVDATSVRQVLHNLLKNATEAAQESIHPEINIRTWVKQDKVMVQIENNGKGFSAHMLQHAFEPYITDKAEGTGLGLAVVKKIIDEHGGRVHLANCADGEGARVTLILSLVHR